VSVSQELWDTFRKLAALEARTEDVTRSVERVGDKLDSLIERISKVEVQCQSLRENVRNEILSDLKADIAVLKFAYGHAAEARPSLPGFPSLPSGNEGTS
jgi:archaellum component FlaC